MPKNKQGAPQDDKHAFSFRTASFGGFNKQDVLSAFQMMDEHVQTSEQRAEAATVRLAEYEDLLHKAQAALKNQLENGGGNAEETAALKAKIAELEAQVAELTSALAAEKQKVRVGGADPKIIEAYQEKLNEYAAQATSFKSDNARLAGELDDAKTRLALAERRAMVAESAPAPAAAPTPAYSPMYSPAPVYQAQPAQNDTFVASAAAEAIIGNARLTAKQIIADADDRLRNTRTEAENLLEATKAAVKKIIEESVAVKKPDLGGEIGELRFQLEQSRDYAANLERLLNSAQGRLGAASNLSAGAAAYEADSIIEKANTTAAQIIAEANAKLDATRAESEKVLGGAKVAVARLIDDTIGVLPQGAMTREDIRKSIVDEMMR